MLVSSLPEVPGHTYELRGLVFQDYGFSVNVGGPPEGALNELVQAIVQQAQRFGANAIIDVKVVTGDRILAVTGTAVRLIRNP
ncbi:hypothetical protein [Longispora albida]|uniref:hypothetical protein n=1 Tax=Longispora albida TaxID=203523 RepID=UPI000378B9A7|nr:hypothetical protein [Longispora albida]